MASYDSYKKVVADQIPNNTFDYDNLASGVRETFCVKWFYGISCRCSAGCCCLWTVPSNVRRANWEMWGAGGNGAGACSCLVMSNTRTLAAEHTLVKVLKQMLAVHIEYVRCRRVSV